MPVSGHPIPGPKGAQGRHDGQRVLPDCQISERLPQHELVDRSSPALASSLTRRACAIAATLVLSTLPPPGQLKTSCRFITAIAEPVLLVSHARIGSAVQRGHQPDQPAGRSREPHPLWSGREFEKSGGARMLMVSPSQGDRTPYRGLRFRRCPAWHITRSPRRLLSHPTPLLLARIRHTA